jgi:hypothetical protein
MVYKVASTFNEILDAWCLVYRQYLAATLIGPNELSVFTFPEYISNNTAVLLGKNNNHTVCTISAVLDSEKKLPLDGYYSRELDRMREEGKKLIEIGLHADARRTTSFQEITDLLAGIARFGVHSNHHDYVIGVHPRRINFYNKIFGFKPVGVVKNYGRLQTAPVVLLHANGTIPEVASLYRNNEIYTDPGNFNFDQRFKFNPQNFITQNEFTNSVETFFKSIWQSKQRIIEAA